MSTVQHKPSRETGNLNTEFKSELKQLKCNQRVKKTTNKPEIHCALTCMGSCVSLIGPTHSSVAETCTQWARAAGLKQRDACTGATSAVLVLTISLLMSRSILTCCRIRALSVKSALDHLKSQACIPSTTASGWSDPFWPHSALDVYTQP